jgi:MFS family permease
MKIVSGKIGATIAVVLAAASTGVVIPGLRALVEHAGRGPVAASVFVDAHVLGGVVGAACGARALQLARSARSLAVAALAGSVAVILVMAALDPFALRVGLRFLDGACHLLAVTALVAAATSGDAELRARRTVMMGIAIVLGVAGGFGLGGALHDPEAALLVAALLSGGALIAVLARVTAESPRVAPAQRSPGRRPIAPGLLAFGERFIFGTLSIAGPFLAPPARVGLVIGVAMAASVVTMPFARRCARAWGARRLAVRSTLAFVATLAAAPVVDVFASSGRALGWALACGVSSGALYTTALVLVARSAALEDRARDMGTVHAAGNAGFALGALCAGFLVAVLPGMLVVTVPGVAIIAAATLGVWLTVPAAARDCPVINGLAALGDDGEPREPARQPVT